LISGFWHGANWTFIVWGGIHALLFIPIFLTKQNRKYINNTISIRENGFLLSVKEILSTLITFFLVTISWVFFRADSVEIAFNYLLQLFTNFDFIPYHHPLGYRMIDYFILLGVFIAYEYIIRKDERRPIYFKSRILRFIVYTILVLGLLLFYDDLIDKSFIYFQF